VRDENNTRIEYAQNYLDILPGEVEYFVADYAHRDISRYNIFEFKFKNGQDVIPAYNNATASGKIYIGFPTKDDFNNNVFALDIGVGSLGDNVPCYFPTGTAISGKSLECRLHTSSFTPNYVWV